MFQTDTLIIRSSWQRFQVVVRVLLIIMIYTCTVGHIRTKTRFVEGARPQHELYCLTGIIKSTLSTICRQHFEDFDAALNYPRKGVGCLASFMGPEILS